MTPLLPRAGHGASANEPRHRRLATAHWRPSRHRDDAVVARRAAGKIHSDLERGFIRAEVTPYETFLELGSEAAVKAAGKLQIEGKDYIVADGDILHVRFNV